MKKTTVILLLIILCFTFTVNAGAVSYTYNSQGEPMESPDAYSVNRVVAGVELGVGKLKKPSDIKISKSGKVVISDLENSRVIITDRSFTKASVLSEFEGKNGKDIIKSPTGMCFDKNDHFYVCDKDNGRIIEFDSDFKYVREIAEIQEELLPAGFKFSPSAVSVDNWGTIYCISDSSTNGYLQFDKTGKFKGFMGSPNVTLTAIDKFWRKMQTKEQRKRKEKQIPINFSNLVVDEEGFVYTTEVNPNKESTAIAIQSGKKDGLFMPIKKFNFNGDSVLKRRDFYAPAGDIAFEKSYAENEKQNGPLWASHLVSITLGDDGCYYVADEKRGKIFGYDRDGNMLYAFGGTGAVKGTFYQLAAIEYHDHNIYALDKKQGTVTCFTLTDYGKELHEAVNLTGSRRFDEASVKWKSILDKNRNIAIAYIGLGRSYLANGEYKNAMNCFKTSLDMDDYTEAFVRYREIVLGKWFLLIPVAIVLFLAVLSFASCKIRKFNTGTSEKRYQLPGHLLYAQYAIFHPFDAFWDIKHEKRGSTGAAAILLVLAAICIAVQNRLMGFSFNNGKTANPLLVILIMLTAAFVFCISNWCLTSLTDGKGNFKDIFTVIGYSCVPLILMALPIIIFSNILTAKEASIISLLVNISYIWTALLIFTGILTVHEYSLGRNVISVIFTLVGMIVIVFLAFLLVNLGGRIMSFITGIINELGLRS